MNLQIKRVDNLKWHRGEGGYYQVSGYALYVENLGYMAFMHEDNNEVPYIPCGGKRALQSIIDQGGLTSYDESIWINPIN